MVLALTASFATAVQPLPESNRIPAAVTATLSVDNPAFHMPTDVAVDSQGDVYVADGARDRLVVLTPDGRLRSATTRPAGRALKRPVGLAIDAKDRLWIADTGGHRLIVLDRTAGQLVETIDLPPLDE
jgi:sugar lactone lactonase YvrE